MTLKTAHLLSFITIFIVGTKNILESFATDERERLSRLGDVQAHKSLLNAQVALFVLS